jgi:hypothetical protein
MVTYRLGPFGRSERRSRKWLPFRELRMQVGRTMLRGISEEERGDEPPAAHILKAGPPSADTGLGASVTQHTFNRVKIR